MYFLHTKGKIHCQLRQKTSVGGSMVPQIARWNIVGLKWVRLQTSIEHVLLDPYYVVHETRSSQEKPEYKIGFRKLKCCSSERTEKESLPNFPVTISHQWNTNSSVSIVFLSCNTMVWRREEVTMWAYSANHVSMQLWVCGWQSTLGRNCVAWRLRHW